jgi:hypothetical protein
MQKAEEYRRHAAECLQLASMSVKPEDRVQLFRMAETWEHLARYREQRLACQQGILQWQPSERSNR